MATIGVLISGRGSNLQALIDANSRQELQAEIRLVVSNVDGAPGLARAQAAGIESVVLAHKGFTDRAAYDRALVDLLRSRGVTLVCLAGFMRLLGPGFCQAFPNAVLNIHPSLLPSFPGLDAQGQAWAHGVRIAGATVHFVTPELDAGPIVDQLAVEVADGDTSATLSQKILAVEHVLYPRALQRVVTQSWRIEGRRVVFSK